MRFMPLCRSLGRVLVLHRNGFALRWTQCAFGTLQVSCRLLSTDKPIHPLPSTITSEASTRPQPADKNHDDKTTSGGGKGTTAPAAPPSPPQWVETRKTNGEQRMSISIRSGAQRSRGRRPAETEEKHPAAFPGASVTPIAAAPHASGVEREESHTRNAAAFSSSSHHSSHGADAPTAPPRKEAASIATTAPRAASNLSTDTPTFSSAGRHASASPPAASATPNAKTTRVIPGDNVSTNEHATTFSSAAAGTSGNSGYASQPPLLYSVSRFTEPVKRIILIRNGRSEANDDVAAYVHTPDWRIPLVEEGRREAMEAGKALSDLIGDDPVYFYYSPYVRSRQSLRYVLQGFDEARLSGCAHTREWWEDDESGSIGSPASSGVSACDTNTTATVSPPSVSTNGTRQESSSTPSPPPSPVVRREASLILDRTTSDSIIGVREDVRLRDGDIGRYTSVEELKYHLLERERYGKFFYRFPHGESGADVCDRVTSFLDAFQRERVEFPMNTNVVMITHGLTMRMLIKRWFHLTVETFHKMKSPPPGSLCTLTRLHHRSSFRLDESCVESMHLPLSLNEFNGYKYRNKRLLGSMSSGAPYM